MKLIPTTINPVTITLYRGIPFDNNYNEHTLLSNKFKFASIVTDTETNVGNSKEAFINMKDSNNVYIYPRTTKTGTFNFAFGNGLVTSVVLELTGDEINSNYMKVVSGEDVYYYFITGITQKNEITYLLNLELDVFMTYSEEFLTNIKDKPVMVERKHCRRQIRYKHTQQQQTQIWEKINQVCYNQETMFNHIKPQIVKRKQQLHFNNYVKDNNDYNSLMEELNWVYVILASNSQKTTFGYYRENGVVYPYAINCFPTKPVMFRYNEQTIDSLPTQQILNYAGDTNVLKIIISPFPPFEYSDNINVTKDSNYYYFDLSECTITTTSSAKQWRFSSQLNGVGSQINIYTSLTTGLTLVGAIQLGEGFGGNYKYKEVSAGFVVPVTSTLSNIYWGRDYAEYKLQLSPFNDLRMSSYYGTENHIPKQVLFLTSLFNSDSNKIRAYTIASSNAESNSYYDYCDLGNYDVASKRGQSNSVAYNFPTSTSAELLFNQTQKNQFDTAKTNAEINGVFKASAGFVVGGSGTLPAQKLGGILTMVGSVEEGIEKYRNYNAKLVDLANTPDKYSFGGSSYPYDMSISYADINGSQSLLPYLITYGVDDVRFNRAGEFLYHYGYEYNAESYFNTTIGEQYDNIFERRVFNYIKIDEDITTKLVGDNLPLIVAKKINEVLNAGITIWTFFNFDLTDSAVVTRVMENYFQKDLYCNAEMNETGIMYP